MPEAVGGVDTCKTVFRKALFQVFLADAIDAVSCQGLFSLIYEQAFFMQAAGRFPVMSNIAF